MSLTVTYTKLGSIENSDVVTVQTAKYHDLHGNAPLT